MAGVKAEDGKKWINAFVAIVSVIVGYVFVQFLEQMGEWFDLEAKVQYFQALSQVAGVIVGLSTFAVVVKRKDASQHLDEVYAELVKVIWPDKDSVLKLTVGIVIGLSIVSGIFVAFDFTFQKILEFLY